MSEYRYTLTRDLSGWYTPRGLHVEPLSDGCLCWVMLNPSTADETLDDPTIRRVQSFTYRGGYRRLVVVNLFGARATNPADLLDHDDPIGPENKRHVEEAFASSGAVVFAWGSWWETNKHRMRRGARLNVEQIANTFGRSPRCLGKTKSGAPRHPLYVKGDTPLEVFR